MQNVLKTIPLSNFFFNEKTGLPQDWLKQISQFGWREDDVRKLAVNYINTVSGYRGLGNRGPAVVVAVVAVVVVVVVVAFR